MKPRLFNGTEWIEFETREQHDNYIAQLQASQPPAPIDFKQIVINRIEKGKEVITEYLADNASINLTFDQSLTQLQKFQVVKAFLEVGNLEDSIILIQNTEVDEVFTQERKDKYLTMLNG